MARLLGLRRMGAVVAFGIALVGLYACGETIPAQLSAATVAVSLPTTTIMDSIAAPTRTSMPIPQSTLPPAITTLPTPYPSATRQVAWQQQIPRSLDVGLASVACPSVEVCYSVGQAGTVEKTSDSGHTWTNQNSGLGIITVTYPDTKQPHNRLVDLTAIACATRNTCYALGSFGIIIATNDGGQTWFRQESGTSDALTAIACPTPQTCYATTNYYAPDQPQTAGLLTTNDGGQTWIERTNFAPHWLNAIVCPTTAVCVVVGNSGIVMSTQDSAKTWTSQTFGSQALMLLSVSCGSATVCITVGNTANGQGKPIVAVTTDAGRHWTATVTNQYFVGLACFTAQRCVTTSTGGTPALTVDGGKTWTLAKGDPLGYMAFACPDAHLCVGVSDHNAIGTTQDGGHTWITRANASPPVETNLWAIGCASRDECGAVGARAEAETTADGGKTWTLRSTGVDSSVTLFNIACPAAHTCIAVGGWGDGVNKPGNPRIVTTPDGGHTWHSITPDTPYPLQGIACPTPDTCYAVGGSSTVLATTDGGRTWKEMPKPDNNHNFNDIRCSAVSTCLAVATPGKAGQVQGGVILATNDGAKTWQTVYSTTKYGFYSITCPSVQTCYGVTNGSDNAAMIVMTIDGGKTWRDQLLPLYSSSRALGCATVDTCYMADNLSGIILGTVDGGKTWKPEAFPGNPSLMAITCPAADTCYALGYEVILTKKATAAQP